MMNPSYEEILRKAASWQAFKEGRDLKDRGAVTEVKSGIQGWQGTVRGGQRPYRVKVSVKSATDLVVHCSCPDNQRTGAVCAHAVATGLAATGNSPDTPTSVKVSIQEEVVAWQIRWPENWEHSLRKGHLSAQVKPLPGESVEEADRSLSAWLMAHGLSLRKAHTLLLRDGQITELLEALHGHTRILTGDGNCYVQQGARIRLSELCREGETVTMHAESDHSDWVRLGSSWWRMGAGGVELLGSGVVPDPDVVASLLAGRIAHLGLLDFFHAVNDWRECLAFPEDSWPDRLGIRCMPHRFRATLDGSNRLLKAKLEVCYQGLRAWPLGEEGMADLPKIEGDLVWQRNIPAEARAIESLLASGFTRTRGEPWMLSGEQAVSDFLANALPIFRDDWDIVESSAIARLAQQSVQVLPRIQMQGSGEDWLSFAVEYRTDDGEVLPPDEVRRLIQGGRVTTRRGKVCHLAAGKTRAWQSLLADLDARQEDGIYRVDRRAGLVIQETARAFSGKETHPDFSFSLPGGFTGTLRPYQASGAAWLAHRTAQFGGAILADDMGLGKTVQTIAWAESLFAQKPDARILVLATTSLLGNWQAEWTKFAPERVTHVLHGADRELRREELGTGEVWITSHATLVRDLAWYLRQELTALVVDEASLLRNPDTDMAKAVRKLRADAKVALTGTPVENRVTDLWSLFSWVQPGWLGGREGFLERFERPSRSVGPEREIALSHLRLKTAPFILRRTKEAVAPELPSKIVIDEFCDMLPEQAKLYAELAREGRKLADAAALQSTGGKGRMAILTTLLRLRQTCCDPALLGSERFKQMDETKRSSKHLITSRLLETALDGGHKVLIFSQFQKLLQEIEKSIKAKQWSCLRLDGQTRNRQEMVDRFQSADGPPIFLISLKAGGYGLNLTAADVVIHMDPWWNPAAEDQATDRAHRIGQVNPVTVYRLLTRGTVEEAVLRMQRNKRALAGAVDETGAGDPTGWSMEDLVSVMGDSSLG